jgi:iron(III) transport system substrate-binding protein
MSRRPLALLVAGVVLLAATLPGCRRDSAADARGRVVLYCAQDREFAEDILKTFTARTGLDVLPRYDTEANKSVSLYEDLVREARRPRCDVYWNNEILGTIRLQRQGLLEPYASPSAAPYPPSCRAPDHTWHAFAGRARVLLVNTKLVPAEEQPRGLRELTEPRWRQRVAMAKPLAGTSATQAACLFQAWGADQAQAWYRALHANGLHVVSGNKQVAEGVGVGQFAVGLTDTDDALAEIDAGRPVVILFPDRDSPKDSRQGTLLIPNTVALIKGAPNPAGARQLIDYLLSAEVEVKLAQSASRQIPLNPEVRVALPGPLASVHAVHALPVDFERAAALWDDAQAFVRAEFARR